MFFLYHERSAPTGRIIGEALGIPHGTVPPVEREDVLVRWGGAQSIRYRPELVVNTRGGISLASNKYGSLERFRERGVPCPYFSRNPMMIEAPFLGRRDSHARGEDILLCMQQSDALREERDYYIEYVPVAREYRIHVFNRVPIKVSEKVLTRPEDYVPWYRNSTSGYTFRNPRVRPGTYQQAAAADAVESLGLSFGAVDLIVGDDGQTYVLEVNSAPSCSTLTARLYVDAFVEAFNSRGLDVTPNYEVLEESTVEEEEDA
jgi:hypothetical protein